MSERMVSTYSMWSLFRNCRKASFWRYIKHLVPLSKARAQSFGSLIHACLESWHALRDIQKVLALIDAAFPLRASDPDQRSQWHLGTAMMIGYSTRYASDNFEVIALEREFEGEIINPETLACSRSFTLAGKVDGIIRLDGQHFLLEHKTAASIDGGYLEKLWTDFQIVLYSHYIEKTMGLHIDGVIYNVLTKAKLKQSEGETEQEFETRRTELIAKSKTGKSSAKRRMPETDEEFQSRLADKYAEQGAFHREHLLISRDQITTLQAELWELTQAFLDARRRDVWYQNSSQCFYFNRPCPYFPLCRSGGSENVIANFYEQRAPNEELSATPATEPDPVF